MEERSVIHHTFVIERSYAAQPERVFAAFADPAKKRRWFAEGEHHDVVLGTFSRNHRLKRNTTMPLTGKDVWDAIVKLGLMSGPYDPKTNTNCANAEKIAGLLNEVLTKRQSWLSNLIETDEAMRVWEANTPHEYVLRLYKFLNTLGYTVVGIDAAIEREVKKRRASAIYSPTRDSPMNRGRQFCATVRNSGRGSSARAGIV